ncbi:M6 family metalloprotease domain-containing protein [Paenibacillus oenotherae]|uniref:M6 family metalloprotease domain-containing protein n=1 Tax=Paenibacillus oenotherae TaxID=1435645 RepID=A0ABS7D5G4_9BACL|nr:M6 family metalloprotease domain-containing protein [Paenibacillus oenotherae]MBW7475174.1 M6 family metalloprotease domain-containing protein [Paenibacillus oenotherae]
MKMKFHTVRYTTSLAVMLLAMLAFAAAAMAMPAREEVQSFEQPTGQTFSGVLKGDEHLNWVETVNGEVLVRDDANYWNYAELVAQEVQPGGEKYLIDGKPKQAVTQEQIEEIAGDQAVELKRSVDPGVSEPNALLSQPHTQPVLVLLIGFTDAGIQYSDQAWSDTFFSTTSKSVKDYYDEVSEGQFSLVPVNETAGTANDGIVKVNLNYAHSGGEEKSVRDALLAADANIDFAAYDTDNDNVISNKELLVVTILGGYEASYNQQLPSVWGHVTSFFDFFVPLDGKYFGAAGQRGDYSMQGERQGDHKATIGIFAHEIGHLLGLIDLYDTDGSSAGIGAYSIMAGGSWNSLVGEYSGATPAHFDAFSKLKLGFAEAHVIESNTSVSYTLNSIGSGNYNIVKVPTLNTDQYFLVENRQKQGYDGSLPYTGGIAIWHIDETRGSNSNDNRRLIDMEEATTGNPFFYNGNATAFNATTTPNSGRYVGYGSDLTYTGISISTTSGNGNAMNINVFGDYLLGPDTPPNFNLVHKTKSTVQLSWYRSSPDTVDYVVFRDGVPFHTTTGTFVKDFGRNGNTTYTYTVRARDQYENLSPASNTIQVTTESTDSSTVYYNGGFTNPYIHYQLNDNAPWVELQMTPSEVPGFWKAVVPIEQYGSKVYFQEGQGGPVQNNSGYYYYAAPGVVTFETYMADGFPPGDRLAPLAPAGLTSTGANATSINLSWSPSSDNYTVTGYKVYQNGVEIATTATTSYSVTGLTASTSYNFTVKAYDGAGNLSPSSDTLTASTTAPGNSVTIYYKKGFATPYIHYRPVGGTWTTSPGVSMPASEITGYNKLTVNIGTATGLEAVFNNGSGTWDNNGGQNYMFPAGTSTFNAGTITSGLPQPSGVTIEVTAPSNTPANAALYVAGSFNSWNPADPAYQLVKQSNGKYTLTFSLPSGTNMQFKITRGAWTNVETNSNGSDINNRTFTTTGGADAINITVQRWKDL